MMENLQDNRVVNGAERGRAHLQAWEDGKPDNFFTSDANLQHVLQHRMGEAYRQAEANFIDFGGKVATLLDEAAKQEDRIGNHPRLERWSPLGERWEQIAPHEPHACRANAQQNGAQQLAGLLRQTF